MARIRTIKPEFFTSEDIVSLSPLARLLYIALWCEADKEGRLVWKPFTFKLRYFPGDSCDIEALCAEILDAGLVVCYGDGYALIPAFHAHQHINPRESASQIPAPDAQASDSLHVTTRNPRVPHASARVDDASARVPHAQGGREGKGREGVLVPTVLSPAKLPTTPAVPSLPKCPVDQIVEAYHDVLPELPRVRLMTDARKRSIAKVWRWVFQSKRSDGTVRAETGEEALGWLRDFFERARDNDFLMGRSKRSAGHENWVADFDFLLTEKGMKQVIEKTVATA